MSKYTVVGAGELLWDVLPDGPRLGGAPANFAYFAQVLGDEGVIVSRVGADADGTAALSRLRQLGLVTNYIQAHSQFPTGTVQVGLDRDGQPTYTITTPVAWDDVEWNDTLMELAARADAVCFGTVAQRSSRTRETLHAFLEALPPRTLRVFDVNLRLQFYSAEILNQSLRLAQLVKVNGDELTILADLLTLAGDTLEHQARSLRKRYQLDLVCVTRGSQGSLLLTSAGTWMHPGIHTTVVDTVGAGDAFAAALTHGWLRKTPLEMLQERANRLAAWVASQSGGMPPLPEGKLPC